MFKPVLSCEHLTNYASVVTLSSDLQRKGGGEGSEDDTERRGGGRSAQIFRNPRSDLKILGARTT